MGQQARYFIPSQHDRQLSLSRRTPKRPDITQGFAQKLIVQKDQRIQRDPLRCRGYAPFDGQKGQEGLIYYRFVI